MRFAIDRYAVGIEKEVSATDFENSYYIPGRLSRFFCPECGEIVYFRNKGGTHPSQFYHQEKTDKTPECDKRVDGRSDLSLSQRVGLPLYLSRMLSGQFQLNIGFPALGHEMLKKAASAGYTVEISYGSQLRTVKVDQTNFIGDSVTLIPVNFLPANGKNYSITISGENAVFGLHRKWADYADGFDLDGAFFTFEESCGKKIRRGDSISTNRSYYAVIKNNLPLYPEIHQQEVGCICFGSSTYRVLKIEINVSVDNKAVFSAISQYLYRHFGIWMLECQPELVPLWPPVIQSDVYSPIFPQANIVCGVSSGNNKPNIYIYSDYGVNQKKAESTANGIWMVEVSAGKRPVTLSVDRKYVGREATFLFKDIPVSNNICEADLLSDRGETIEWANVDERFLSGKFTIRSNGKMELYTGSREKNYRHISIREAITQIPARENTQELYLTNGEGILRHICISNKSEIIDDLAIIATKIRNSRKCRMVPIPVWADAMIRSLKRHHSLKLYDSIMAFIENGNIPVEVLKQLRLAELENQGVIF